MKIDVKKTTEDERTYEVRQIATWGGPFAFIISRFLRSLPLDTTLQMTEESAERMAEKFNDSCPPGEKYIVVRGSKER